MNHILIILSQSFNPNDGGVQRTSFKIGEYLSSNGYKVSYFSFAIGGHISAEFATLFHVKFKGGRSNQQNVNYFNQVIMEIRPSVVINQMPYDKDIRNALTLMRTKVDFVLFACLHNSLFSFKNNLQDKVNYLIPKSIRWLISNKLGLYIINKYHDVKHKKVLREVLHIHDYFVFLTESNIKELKYFVGNLHHQKLKVIPNSISEVYSVEKEKENILLHVGRINIPQKRSDLLIPVWKEICSSVSDWKFVIVGDGPYMKTMKKIIETDGINGIELVGYQAPDEYYKRAPIFIMTSAYEGFPNVIIEAQSYGNVPFAMDSYFALRDIVNDGEDAVLCKPFDTKEMGQKIINLMQNSRRLNEMMSAASKNAERFTMERVGKLWIELIENTSKKA